MDMIVTLVLALTVNGATIKVDAATWDNADMRVWEACEDIAEALGAHATCHADIVMTRDS